jgi:hypothetical protein
MSREECTRRLARNLSRRTLILIIFKRRGSHTAHDLSRLLFTRFVAWIQCVTHHRSHWLLMFRFMYRKNCFWLLEHLRLSNDFSSLSFPINKPSLSTVGALILVIYFFVDPYKRGFFCDDETLMHPYKDNTVTMTLLVSVGICVPVAVVRASFKKSQRLHRPSHRRQPNSFPEIKLVNLSSFPSLEYFSRKKSLKPQASTSGGVITFDSVKRGRSRHYPRSIACKSLIIKFNFY